MLQIFKESNVNAALAASIFHYETHAIDRVKEFLKEHTIPFNGTQKITFNQYFKPALSMNRGICSKADLLGNWTVVFQGTDYNNLKFEIVDRYIPGEEKNYEEPVC